LLTVYRPNSTAKDYYSENPANYFSPSPDPRWWFRTGQGADAEMVSPDPEVLRVNIRKSTGTAYDVQLNLTNLKLDAGKQYRVKFRARADASRVVSAGVSQSHEPWNGLGLYSNVDLTPEWKDYQLDFASAASENNARIHFDAGASDIALEISGVQLITAQDGKVVDSAHKNYLVSYRFNSLGCRGPDYQIPKPSGTRRILVLGDSSAMGAGVKEEDTVSARLQKDLQNSYEVINCGVADYGAQAARLFYKFKGVKYQPDVVTLFLSTTAGNTVLEELNPQRPLFFTWHRFWKHFYPFDYSDAAEEIIQLNLRLRNDHSRLAVVLFRNNSDYNGKGLKGKQWNALTRDVSKKLKWADIPVLDLSTALFQNHSVSDLAVLPKKDSRPSAIAHKIAADELRKFLETRQMITP